jgi:2,4-dienoyl-CoA reductase (NADPH2)
VRIARESEDAESLSVGERVVVLGANLIGIELAEHLAKLGKRVSVLEPSRRLAMPAGKKRRGDHGVRLDRLGVPVNTGVDVRAIEAEGVRIGMHDGSERVIGADTVIVVGQPDADDAVARAFEGCAPEVHVVGDTSGFGLAQKAVREAMVVGWGI